MTKTLLVVGAQKKSLGKMCAQTWSDMFDAPAVTAGISGDEDHNLNLADHEEIVALLGKVQPDRILVTVGVNYGRSHEDLFDDWMLDHLQTNAIYPLRVLEAWFEAGQPPEGAHFVAISSNSAHIPRSSSMAYCASKAALSMGLRCAARDIAKAGVKMSVYGYEPGLIKGTPMTDNMPEFSGPPTRMLGLPLGLSKRALANQITHTLAMGGAEQNGVLYRVDAGEI